jgi:hypothetical protein
MLDGKHDCFRHLIEQARDGRFTRRKFGSRQAACGRRLTQNNPKQSAAYLLAHLPYPLRSQYGERTQEYGLGV